MWSQMAVVSCPNPLSIYDSPITLCSVRSQHSIWSDIGINEPFWVAFKHTTGFLIGGDDDDGKGRIIHSYNDKYSKQHPDAHPTNNPLT
jgi:hypothetical protein